MGVRLRVCVCLVSVVDQNVPPCSIVSPAVQLGPKKVFFFANIEFLTRKNYKKIVDSNKLSRVMTSRHGLRSPAPLVDRPV